MILHNKQIPIVSPTFKFSISWEMVGDLIIFISGLQNVLLVILLSQNAN